MRDLNSYIGAAGDISLLRPYGVSECFFSHATQLQERNRKWREGLNWTVTKFINRLRWLFLFSPVSTFSFFEIHFFFLIFTESTEAFEVGATKILQAKLAAAARVRIHGLITETEKHPAFS